MSKFIGQVIRLLAATTLFFVSFSEIAKWAVGVETNVPIGLAIFWLFGAVASAARKE